MKIHIHGRKQPLRTFIKVLDA